mgnify:FL=1
MSFFDWSAPLIRRYGDRFTAEDAEAIAGWLRHAVPADGHVLDVGGGSGQLAALLSQTLDARVTVLDPTANLLAHVPSGERITAVAGSAESMPLPDSTVDAIVVTDAFHHFRDQSAAASEFARVTRPEGAVLVLDLDPRPLGIRLVALAERLVGEPGAFMTPEQMCAFMAERGIPGECVAEKGASYRFLGRVSKDRPAA